jgi:hypothetical protein
MSRKNQRRPTVEELGYDIRSEMRRIIRKWSELGTPYSDFRLLHDRPEGEPRHQVMLHRGCNLWSGSGFKLKTKSLAFPDERLEDAIFDLHRAVWHLSDRLKLWTREHGIVEQVDKFGLRSKELRICSDLVNRKKHFRDSNDSGLFPFFDVAHFDTSQSGVVELQYNGAIKESALLVSEPIPLRVTVSIYSDEMDGSVRTASPRPPDRLIGDAVEIAWKGFRHWMVLIDRVGVLDPKGNDADIERLALRNILMTLP